MIDALVQVCGEHSSGPPMHGSTLGLLSGVVKAPGDSRVRGACRAR